MVLLDLCIPWVWAGLSHPVKRGLKRRRCPIGVSRGWLLVVNDDLA